jgi:alkylated DNA repair dioxygenase AlkB
MEVIPIPGAELYFEPHFLPANEAAELLELLLKKCRWERRQTSFGFPVPRDEAYYGDPGTQYTYSRREYRPLPWIPELLQLSSRVAQAVPDTAYDNLSLSHAGFNAVLCNLYRNGNDSVGLHADAEPEMGPVIASLSLGAERLFRLKGKDGKVTLSHMLPHGSLLIMAGATQKNFKHDAPKQPDITEPRINLTFRRIEHKP